MVNTVDAPHRFVAAALVDNMLTQKHVGPYPPRGFVLKWAWVVEPP
jgi:hypothetical protein